MDSHSIAENAPSQEAAQPSIPFECLSLLNEEIPVEPTIYEVSKEYRDLIVVPLSQPYHLNTDSSEAREIMTRHDVWEMMNETRPVNLKVVLEFVKAAQSRRERVEKERVFDLQIAEEKDKQLPEEKQLRSLEILRDEARAGLAAFGNRDIESERPPEWDKAARALNRIVLEIAHHPLTTATSHWQSAHERLNNARQIVANLEKEVSQNTNNLLK